MNEKRISEDFEQMSGCSFSDVVSMWRLCHARDLLLQKVPYALIWKLSGFKSLKEMEREWNRLVY